MGDTLGMHTEGLVTFLNNEAAATILQYYCVAVDPADSGGGKAVAATDDKIIGVVIADIPAGEAGSVVTAGRVYVIADEAIAIGATLYLTAAGRVEPRYSDPGYKAVTIVGTALEAAIAQGDIILCQLQIDNAYAS